MLLLNGLPIRVPKQVESFCCLWMRQVLHMGSLVLVYEVLEVQNHLIKSDSYFNAYRECQKLPYRGHPDVFIQYMSSNTSTSSTSPVFSSVKSAVRPLDRSGNVFYWMSLSSLRRQSKGS